MGPTGCSKTLVRKCLYMLHNNPEECSSQLLRSGSLKIMHRLATYLIMINLKEGYSLEALTIGRKIILKLFLQKWDQIHLAQKRNKIWALTNTAQTL